MLPGAEMAARSTLLGSHERVRTAGAIGGWKAAAVPCDFSPPFTVQATHLGGEGGLAKKWILIQYVWGGA